MYLLIFMSVQFKNLRKFYIKILDFLCSYTCPNKVDLPLDNILMHRTFSKNLIVVESCEISSSMLIIQLIVSS